LFGQSPLPQNAAIDKAMADKLPEHTNSNSLFASISVYSRFKIECRFAVRSQSYGGQAAETYEFELFIRVH
jgi:hypothetical protein